MRRLWQKKTALLFALLFLAAEVLTPIKALAYTVESPKEDTAGMELSVNPGIGANIDIRV